MAEFVFMLTHRDRTVANPRAVYEKVRGTGLRYVGFKDVGSSVAELSAVTRAAHDDGLEVMLEVVSTSEQAELTSIASASEIGVDWVLGGTHPEQGATLLADVPARYCPFPGVVEDHPSVLKGSVDAIAEHAMRLTAMAGVHGLDLLAYRHETVDPLVLIQAVVRATSSPVIVAGSVASFTQIRAITAAGAWGFTIGGAIFEGRLPGAPSIGDQVRAVLAACTGRS
jgi:DhnA family fructose-bisphosphate aldolase class Ia